MLGLRGLLVAAGAAASLGGACVALAGAEPTVPPVSGPLADGAVADSPVRALRSGTEVDVATDAVADDLPVDLQGDPVVDVDSLAKPTRSGPVPIRLADTNDSAGACIATPGALSCTPDDVTEETGGVFTATFRSDGPDATSGATEVAVAVVDGVSEVSVRLVDDSRQSVPLVNGAGSIVVPGHVAAIEFLKVTGAVSVVRLSGT